MAKHKKWKLNWEDVHIGGAGHASILSHGKKRSWYNAVRSEQITLHYKPTGCSVSGEIPSGRYHKKKLKELIEKLTQELFIELERVVAKKLRISGR